MGSINDTFRSPRQYGNGQDVALDRGRPHREGGFSAQSHGGIPISGDMNNSLNQSTADYDLDHSDGPEASTSSASQNKPPEIQNQDQNQNDNRLQNTVHPNIPSGSNLNDPSVPVSKRTLQNRKAQREFRQRRASYLKDLEERVRRYESGHIEANLELQNLVKSLQEEVGYLREVNSRLLRELEAHGGQIAQPTPPLGTGSPSFNNMPNVSLRPLQPHPQSQAYPPFGYSRPGFGPGSNPFPPSGPSSVPAAPPPPLMNFQQGDMSGSDRRSSYASSRAKSDNGPINQRTRSTSASSSPVQPGNAAFAGQGMGDGGGRPQQNWNNNSLAAFVHSLSTEGHEGGGQTLQPSGSNRQNPYLGNPQVSPPPGEIMGQGQMYSSPAGQTAVNQHQQNRPVYHSNHVPRYPTNNDSQAYQSLSSSFNPLPFPSRPLERTDEGHEPASSPPGLKPEPH